MFIKYLLHLHLALAVLICLCKTVSTTPLLASNEVETLKQVGQILGKTDWDFSVDPCSGQRNWSNPYSDKEFENAVRCDCSFNDNTVCHVVSIVLKVQNLQGTLPKEFINLPFLQEIDLTRNYLSGTIPAEWGSMQLVNVSLLVNRLSGPLPKELGNISTLANLTLEYNQFSGKIPPELGNLSNLERILLSSNNFTGQLPPTLAKWSKLTEFRINDNNFVGSIPSFIQNWTNLKKLAIQASGLSGPIPPGISLLKNLTDLRISDLNGNDSAFPDLSGANSMITLILRSCSIVGVLPDYLGQWTSLTEVLDVSFNKLSGQLPKSLSGLVFTNYIYLTGNFLTGEVPDWMLNGEHAVDLSYNNFTAGNSSTVLCKGRNSNLFSSSSRANTSGIVSCLRSSQCPMDLYTTLNINCGGKAVEADDDDNKIYEDDVDPGGPSNFFLSKTNWAFSSTGHFLANAHSKGSSYILTNTSQMSTHNPELYKTARLSPLSLTYYGFCLVNGNYTVNLHFVENRFTNDRTCNSLGRRVFDIYIQGKLIRKDFNIEEEAGGVYKPIVKPFIVQVIDNTLEIRFYWAGKGTTAIPDRGVYGPLISAISVHPNFHVPSAHKNRLSIGAIVGIVIGVLFAISLLLVILWWKGFIFNKDTIQHDLRGLNLQTSSFTLKEIKAATNNFDKDNKIGEGGFGPVYKGIMPNGTIIAVKQLSSKSKQGNREFINEIGMVSALQHPNLVKLYGCCIEGNQLLLIYEYMENNSLARALFGPEEQQLELDWKTRHKICVGIARGLAYLHEESRLKIVHRDIKATNVLLDNNMNPKISDFGIAKLDEQENTHMSTRIAGTFGYMAPEYAMRGHLTDKADVYSFGIVLLEILSGKSNANIITRKKSFYLLDWANLLKERGDLIELVDERLVSNFNKKEFLSTINIALLCTDILPNCRPNMSAVLSMLEHGVVDTKFLSESSGSNDKIDPKEPVEMENLSLKTKEETSISINVAWTTYESTADHFPLRFDTNPGR